MGEADGELNDLCFVDSISEEEVGPENANLAPSDLGVIAAPLSYGFFSKLYTNLRQSIMDCVYNYCLPSKCTRLRFTELTLRSGVSELPAFSSSDVLMVGGRVIKKV